MLSSRDGSERTQQMALERREAATLYRRAAASACVGGEYWPVAVRTARSAMAELVKLDHEQHLTESKSGIDTELRSGTIVDILKRYGIGGYERAESPVRERRHPNRHYEVTTANGKFFLKHYSSLTPEIEGLAKREGLFLAEYLAERGYPSSRVLPADDGVPWLIRRESDEKRGSAFALFDFVEFPRNGPLSEANASVAGKALAEFQRLSRGFPVSLSEEEGSGKRAEQNFSELWKNIADFSPRQRKSLEYMNEIIGEILPWHVSTTEAPIGVCHTEFIPNPPYVHVGFVNRQVVLVCDFDIIESGPFINDAGMLFLSAVTQKNGAREYKIDYNVGGRSLYGYAQARQESGFPLTDFEWSHVYEATLRAMFRYVAGRGAKFNDYEPFGMVDVFMDTSKEKFQNELGEVLGGIKLRE